MQSGAEPRVATLADTEAVREIFTGAFRDDPVWGWAFPVAEGRMARRTVLWRFFVAVA